MARGIQQAKQSLGLIPALREEKVAELKDKIDNGSYTIDQEKIASEMIKEALLNEIL